MLSPLEQIAARLGITPAQLEAEAPPEPVQARFDAVNDGPELRRILALPRRTPPAECPEELEQLAITLTQKLARHADPYPCGRQYGKRNSGYMRPIQAGALRECWEFKGLLGPIRAGYGKTLVSYLLPSVLGSKRPLYVCPASLRPDVRTEFRQYHQHWFGPHPDHYRIVSYQSIGAKGAGTRYDVHGQKLREAKLDQWQPDLIVFDECQFLKSQKATVRKRVMRFLQDNPGVPVVMLSGTMTRTSLLDYAHLARASLPRVCPVPMKGAELEAWADALDEKETIGPRCQVGELRRFMNADELARCDDPFAFEEDRRSIARIAVRRRLIETPGVVATLDGPLGIPLELLPVYPSRPDPAVDEVISRIRLVKELPNGRPIVDALEMARHLRTLGLGLWKHWDPAPPDEWLRARREWADVVKHALQYLGHSRQLDSESDVKAAVKAGRLKDHGTLAEWEKWEPEYDPEKHVVAVWTSDEIVHTVADWLKGHAGIVWVQDIPVGERLSRELGIPYYGAEGLSSEGKYIMKHPHGKPMIASAAANRMGRNLQKGWHEGLLLTVPDEQLLARTHRDGQDADVVRFYLHVGCYEHARSYWKAVSKARYAQEMTGQAQRLVYADSTTIPDPDHLGMLRENTARWVR